MVPPWRVYTRSLAARCCGTVSLPRTKLVYPVRTTLYGECEHDFCYPAGNSSWHRTDHHGIMAHHAQLIMERSLSRRLESEPLLPSRTSPSFHPPPPWHISFIKHRRGVVGWSHKNSAETEPVSAHSHPPQPLKWALWRIHSPPWRLPSIALPLSLWAAPSLLIKQLRSSLLPCLLFPSPRFFLLLLGKFVLFSLNLVADYVLVVHT